MNTQPSRVTGPTLEILGALLSSEGQVWGLELVRQTGLKTGTVYPILARLENLGWIQSSWEENQKHKGPRRRLWELTKSGKSKAEELVASKKKVENSKLSVKVSTLNPRAN